MRDGKSEEEESEIDPESSSGLRFWNMDDTDPKDHRGFKSVSICSIPVCMFEFNVLKRLSENYLLFVISVFRSNPFGKNGNPNV